MTEILFVRHGRPLSGELDPPLSGEGRRQALALGQWLLDERVDVIVSSPLSRALQTAVIAGASLRQPVSAVLDGLREWDLDHDPEGRYVALEELGSANPRFEALRTGRYEDFVPPIDRNEFLARARGVLDEIIERWSGARIAAFSHGGLINAVFANVLGIEDRMFFFLPEYTSISTVLVAPGGRRVVSTLNQSSHLRGGVDANEVAAAPPAAR